MQDDAPIEELIEALNDSDGVLRAEAARLLVNRHTCRELVLPVLLSKSNDPEWMVRCQLPRAVVYFGMPIAHALPLLRDLLEDPERLVRLNAEWALRKIGQSNNVPNNDVFDPILRCTIPELKGQRCGEFLLSFLPSDVDNCRGLNRLWMRFNETWHSLQYDCLLFWQEHASKPPAKLDSKATANNYQLLDLGDRFLIRGVVITQLETFLRADSTAIRFQFANGVNFVFEEAGNWTYRFSSEVSTSLSQTVPSDLPSSFASGPTETVRQTIGVISDHSDSFLCRARAEAIALQHEWVGSEHLLIALSAVQVDVASLVLADHGVNRESLIAGLLEIVGPSVAILDPSYSLSARSAVEGVLLNHNRIVDTGVESALLLLAILEQKESVAVELLRGLGVNVADMQKTLLHGRH